MPLSADDRELKGNEAAAPTVENRKQTSGPVTGQRSNQLNYVPNLFSYLYQKPSCLLAFLRFNRFACVACFNPVELEERGYAGPWDFRRCRFFSYGRLQ